MGCSVPRIRRSGTRTTGYGRRPSRAVARLGDNGWKNAPWARRDADDAASAVRARETGDVVRARSSARLFPIQGVRADAAERESFPAILELGGARACRLARHLRHARPDYIGRSGRSSGHRPPPAPGDGTISVRGQICSPSISPRAIAWLCFTTTGGIYVLRVGRPMENRIRTWLPSSRGLGM